MSDNLIAALAATLERVRQAGTLREAKQAAIRGLACLQSTTTQPAFCSTETGYVKLGLTRRESEILHWIALGKRDAEIAVILGISRRTVSKHVENVLAKLQVETRTGAVTTALARVGLARAV